MRAFSVFVALVVTSAFSVSPAEGQEDRLWVECPGFVMEHCTVHTPVYATVNAHGDTGLTGVTLMFGFDKTGPVITSIEWCGTCIGEVATAIETHIGPPVLWAMDNTCGGDSCRGGTSQFTFGTSPSIPSGDSLLLCWLVVDTGPAGDYLICPKDSIGTPPLINTFVYGTIQSYPDIAQSCCYWHGRAHALILGDYLEGFREARQKTVDIIAVDTLGIGGDIKIFLDSLSGTGCFGNPPDQSPTFELIESDSDFAKYAFTWTPSSCSSLCDGWIVAFRATLSLNGEPIDTVRLVDTLRVENTNRSSFLTFVPETLAIAAGEFFEYQPTWSDSDVTECGDDTLTWSYTIDDSFENEVDFNDATGVLGVLTTEADWGPHNICFTVRDLYDSMDTECMTVLVLPGGPITLKVKKVEAYPGQQHVCVPVALTLRNPEIEIGGWEVLIWYDPAAGTVVGVDPYGCGADSVRAHDPEFADPDGWEWIRPLFAQGGYEPEYFTYVLGADGHANRVRVVGLMNLDWPQYVTPDLDSAQNDILFSLIVDVAPGWEGHEMFFGFEVKNCTDNTFSDSQGNTLWGPRGDSRPAWLSCSYHGETDVVELFNYPAGSPGLYIEEVERGDVNCDGVPYSVADAMLFINYLVYGVGALSGCPSFEVHCQAADVDDDDFCFTVADLIKLLRIINGYEMPLPMMKPGQVTVSVRDGVVSTDAGVGAILLTFDGEGDVSGDGVTFGYADGKTKVLVYSLENRAIEAGQLFTIAGDVKLIEAEAADFYGGPMLVKLNTVPTTYVLAQSYPNPFNLIAEIRYDLPVDCKVNLEVYNLPGQRVATLVDEGQQAGHRSVHWDASSFSSGIYFYRISAGDFVETRKMILLR